MPLGGSNKKEYQKDYMRRKRSNKEAGLTEKGLTKEGLTGQGLTEDGTYFKDGVEMVPPLGTLPERPRYLILSDGQRLDRAHPPKADLTLWPGWRIRALRACNEADKMKPLMVRPEAEKVLEGLKAKYGL